MQRHYDYDPLTSQLPHMLLGACMHWKLCNDSDFLLDCVLLVKSPLSLYLRCVCAFVCVCSHTCSQVYMLVHHHRYINVDSVCLSFVSHHDAVSFPRFEVRTAYQLCQWHTHASNIPDKATCNQRFGLTQTNTNSKQQLACGHTVMLMQTPYPVMLSVM